MPLALKQKQPLTGKRITSLREVAALVISNLHCNSSMKSLTFYRLKLQTKEVYLPMGRPSPFNCNSTSVFLMSSWQTSYSMHAKAFTFPVFTDSKTAQRISLPSMNL